VFIYFRTLHFLKDQLAPETENRLFKFWLNKLFPSCIKINIED